MKILAIDTSSRQCQVGLWVDGCLFERRETQASHSRIILHLIDELLQAASMTVRDVELIALTRGPGSFTGLRIGIAVAQGLSFAAGIPVLPLSTLQIIAFGLRQKLKQEGSHCVLATVDARMNQLYAGWYVCGSETAILLGSEQVLSPEAVVELRWPACVEGQWKLTSTASPATLSNTEEQGTVLMAGSGLDYKDQLPQDWLAALDTYPEQTVTLQALVDLATATVRRVGMAHCVNASELLPDYLRNKVVD